MTRTRLIFLSLIALVLAGLMIRLGLWQLDRLEERRQVNRERIVRRTAPPVKLPVSGGADELLEQNAAATGRFVTDTTYRILNRTYRGVPGHEVVNVFKLTDGELLLVNRGLFPLDQKGEPPTPLTEQTTLRGFLYFPIDDAREPHPAKLPPTDWVVLDPDAMSEESGQYFLPYALVLTERLAEGIYPLPKRVPAVDEGPHMSYAIQWFSFALIALVGIAGLIWTYLRKRRV